MGIKTRLGEKGPPHFFLQPEEGGSYGREINYLHFCMIQQEM